MYEPLCKGLGLKAKVLNHVEGLLYGFSREIVMPSRKVTINLKAGPVFALTEFFVPERLLSLQCDPGRPWLHRMGAVPSTLH